MRYTGISLEQNIKPYLVHRNKSLLWTDPSKCTPLKLTPTSPLISYYLEHHHGNNRDVKPNCRSNENRDEIILWSEINKQK